GTQVTGLRVPIGPFPGERMKKRSAAAKETPPDDVVDIAEELNIYRRMREGFDKADQRLYELSQEFNALGDLLRLRNASPTGLLPERLSVPMQAAGEPAGNEWCLSRELTQRVRSEMSKAAKAQYHETPIG